MQTAHAGVIVLPAQDHGFVLQKEALDVYTHIRMGRIIGRDPRAATTAGFIYQTLTRGDVRGGFLWIPAGPGSREQSIWSFAVPTVMYTGSHGAPPNIPPGGNGPLVDEGEGWQQFGAIVAPAGAGGPGSGRDAAFPIYNEKYQRDTRFAAEYPYLNDCMGKMPGGTIGITLDTIQEDRQRALFFPCDSRLVAVNHAGDPLYSSRVFDLTSDNSFDCERWAHLHSMMRVMTTQPGPKFPFDPDFNALAWQLGASGKGKPDEGYGLVVENLAGQPVAAVASARLAGPLTAGFVQDKHQGAVDKDGIPYNAAHIGLNAYYIEPSGQVAILVGPGLPPVLTEVDGPEEFDPNIYTRPSGGPVRLPVFKRWDPIEPHDFLGDTRDGKLRWEVDGWIQTIQPPPPPPPLPPDDPPRYDDNGQPIPQEEGQIVPGTLEWKELIKDVLREAREPKEFRQYDKDQDGVETYGGFPAPMIINGNIYRAIMDTVTGHYDTRGRGTVDPAALKKMNDEAPAVMREEALPCKDGDEINYTDKPKTGRYVGGTSSGAVVKGPPEMDAHDFLNLRLPGDLPATSTPIETTYPGAQLGFGPYDQAICNISDGHKIIPSDTNDGTTEIVAVDNTGAETTIITLTQTGVELTLDTQPLHGYEEKFRTPSDWVSGVQVAADTTDPRNVATYIDGQNMTYTIKGKVPDRYTPDPVDTTEWQLGISVDWWSPTAGSADWEPKLAIYRSGQDVSAVSLRGTTDGIEATTNTADELETTTWYVGDQWPEYPSPGDTWYLVLERNPQDPFDELQDDIDVVNVYARWYNRTTTPEWHFPEGYALGGIAVATVSSSQLDVTWTDPLNNIDVVRLDIATTASGPWSTVSPGTAVATQLISVGGLSSGTTYYFRARGQNTAGTEWGDWDTENGTTS
jgi:hypothetical protein